MITVNGKKYYNSQEVEQTVERALKKYYYQYVENLEKEHDEMFDKVTELETILNSIDRHEDIERYRNMVKKANEERDAAKKDLAKILNDINEGRLRRWNT